MSRSLRYAVVRCALAILLGGSAAFAAGPPALEPSTPETLARARELVDSMQRSTRGPYSRILWFCKDGTVLPPRPYACVEHGGGKQHAEYSGARAELAALGWPVGTIFAALSWDEFWDAERRQTRMRELPLERFLVDTREGWVLRQAQFYRGRVQLEDEQAAGRELLLKMLAQREWLPDNFLLAREVARTVPHDGGEDRTRNLRRLSQQLAERDPSFERLRIRIHTAPGATDLRETLDWIDKARKRGVAADILAQAEELAKEMEVHYGQAGRRERLQAARRVLEKAGADAASLSRLDGLEDLSPADRLTRLAGAMADLRQHVVGEATPKSKLALIDLSLDLETAVLATAFEALDSPALSRRAHLALATDLLRAVYGAGFLSERERAALSRPLTALLETSAVNTEGYLEATDTLQRAAGWALGSLRYVFAEPLVRWPELEPGASRFVDDLLRGSPMLPLAEVARRVTLDARTLAGQTHRVFGTPRAGMLGLNPGMAIGRLRVLDPDDASGVRPSRDEIVVLPETVSDLTPVAGILTLSEGNLLSHVQLLARNLGIPNATLRPDLRAELEQYAGKEVLLAVGGDGSVLLQAVEKLPRDLLEASSAKPVAPDPVSAPRPDLSVRRPLPLSELHAGLAGKVVGPKAANLGELARRFPGKVAPAVALPFGVFNAHVTAGPGAPKARLDLAFARHRSGELDAAGLAEQIETVRRQVTGLRVSDNLRAALLPMMKTELGEDGTYGVFVRSDTNVEDLPGFTGAGLNLTVPNVVGSERILATIPRVWASPFTERSMAWREQLLRDPEEVYSSVLLMRSVNSDKSGVMVTVDLATRKEGLTVATAWGVGGAVDGDAAETVVLRPDGSTTLIAEARAGYRRRLREDGGLEWVAAAPGRVLGDDEIAQLRDLAAEVARVMKPSPGPDGAPLPWDIEFGFVGGRLTLFQIRPLVERGSARADRFIARLAPNRRGRRGAVALDCAPGTNATESRPDVCTEEPR